MEKKGPEATSQVKEAAVAFSFSDSFPPILAKLVTKINDFVDIVKLLRGSIEAEHRQGQEKGDSSTNSSGSSKPSRCEVPDVLSWCQCFGINMSVIATKQPERISQMLAYQAMLV